ncbi:hypothetical protein T439DRAFT_25605 [Meredithblackwellia eburnea MCA 4105]
MSGVLDGAASKIRSTKKGDLKPKTHHFFHVLIWIIGWFAPPLAVLVRFGFGKDFFINILCTICGYFPGHFHNFYCQTIRNNDNKARTPRWAVKYGLVKVKDRKAGKHQWRGRYDERLPDSARHGYEDDEEGGGGPGGEEWDGRGPEPAKRTGVHRFGRGGGGGDHKFNLSPWNDEVDPDEVEGGYGGPDIDRAKSGGGPERPFDPIDNEQFYDTTSGGGGGGNGSDMGGDYGNSSATKAGGIGFGRSASRKSSTKIKKPKGIKGILSHRDRYESQSSETYNNGGGAGNGNSNGDRFDRMAAARGNDDGYGGGGSQEYQDEFEAELNGGTYRRPGGASSGGGARYDSFDQEGPEDAWRSSSTPASPVKSNRTGTTVAASSSSARASPAPIIPTKTGGTVQGTKEDDDLFNHTF